MSKYENLSNKTPKKTNKFGSPKKKKKKKKKPTPNFAHKIMKRKKPKPHRLWLYNVWGVVHSWFTTGEPDLLIVAGLVSEDLVFSAWFWLWWLRWVTGCMVLDRLRECLRQGSDNLGRRWDWEWVRVGEESGRLEVGECVLWNERISFKVYKYIYIYIYIVGFFCNFINL